MSVEDSYECRLSDLKAQGDMQSGKQLYKTMFMPQQR
jgi:hypothetical protein